MLAASLKNAAAARAGGPGDILKRGRDADAFYAAGPRLSAAAAARRGTLTVRVVATHPEAPETESRNMALVVEAARNAVVQEFQIAERLDAKARNQMVICGAWYAVVSAVAGVALRASIDAAGVSDWVIAAIVVLAGAGAVCLTVAMFFSYGVWRLRTESEVTHEGLAEMVGDARTPGLDVAERLVEHYGALLALRRANNKTRAENFKRSVPWWMAALLCALFELVFALAALAQA